MTEKTSPAADPSATKILVDALRRAEKAHGEYETKELGGVRDEDWPQWYAEHMLRTLGEAGYQLTRAS